MGTFPTWRGGAPLLLASASTTRRGLIEAAGLPVETAPAPVDERALEAAMGAAAPCDIAVRLAQAKARSVARLHPNRIVVGADQVLEHEGAPLGKPASLDEAKAQLARLSGSTHTLHSAIAVETGTVSETHVESARLTMRRLDPAAIDAYTAQVGEAVCTSAGGYHVEGLGIHLFERIEGEHTTILGLPMLPLLALFRRLQLIGI